LTLRSWWPVSTPPGTGVQRPAQGQAVSDRLRFDGFEICPTERQLLVDGVPVRIGSRAFDVLLVLVSHRGRLVTKTEVLDEAWPGLIVEEANVQVQVSALRKALGPHVIATIPGMGYRLSTSLVDDKTDRVAPPTSGTDGAAGSIESMSNVPLAIDDLVGRADDREQLEALLVCKRLVTITGPGGVGKTTLAAAVVRASRSALAPAVRWVDLAAVTAGDQVAAAIAKAAELALGDADPLTALQGALAIRHLLLVIDNCEHLVDDVASTVQALLAAAPGLAVLATSQRPLRVPGETVFALAPLPVPPEGASLEQAMAHGAMQLLQQRAAALDRRFTVSRSNLEAAIDLCRRLEGLPMAIEMAAARLPTLGFSGLGTLAGSLDRLRRPHAGARWRHDSLRRTLEWSCALLTQAEGILLRRLSAFAGSFGLDAARAATVFGALDAETFIDALVGLVDKSLVKVVQAEPPRYRLLATTKLYAAELSVAAGEQPTTERHHGAAMAALAECAQGPDRAMPSAAWLAKYLPDYDDLDLAFVQACDRGDADIAAAVVVPLRLIDQLRGLFANSGRRLVSAPALLHRASPLGQARLYGFIASCGWARLPELDQRHAAIRAAVLWRGLQNPRELHGSLAIAATETARTGDPAAAAALLEEARNLEAPGWPARTLAVRMIHEGWVAMFAGDGRRYRDRVAAAVALWEDCGETAFARATRVMLASSMLGTGEVSEAIAQCRQVTDAPAPSDSMEFRSFAHCVLCESLLLAGDRPVEARAAAREAMRLAGPAAAHLVRLLAAVAVVAALGHDHATALRLLGCVDEQGPSDAQLLASFQSLLEQARQACIDALGTERARRLLAAGATLETPAALRIAQDSSLGDK
jgi:predicted ATPase/DNA-binding winged helix-turn-helix (wHTH) protein